MTAFNELPLEVQATVKSRLTAYSKVHVSLNEGTGAYTAMSAIVIHNGTYDKHIGTYKSEDVFTLEERIVNYVKSFRDFPYYCANGAHYTGKKDWKALNGVWDDVSIDNEGNLVFS